MNLFEIIRIYLKGTATEYIDAETNELEKLFAFLLFAPLLGYPMPTTMTAMRLLPYTSHELELSLNIFRDSDDMFGKIAGMFDID